MFWKIRHIKLANQFLIKSHLCYLYPLYRFIFIFPIQLFVCLISFSQWVPFSVHHILFILFRSSSYSNVTRFAHRHFLFLFFSFYLPPWKHLINHCSLCDGFIFLYFFLVLMSLSIIRSADVPQVQKANILLRRKDATKRGGVSPMFRSLSSSSLLLPLFQVVSPFIYESREDFSLLCWSLILYVG